MLQITLNQYSTSASVLWHWNKDLHSNIQTQITIKNKMSHSSGAECKSPHISWTAAEAIPSLWSCTHLCSESEACSTAKDFWPASITTFREVPSAYVVNTLQTCTGEHVSWAFSICGANITGLCYPVSDDSDLLGELFGRQHGQSPDFTHHPLHQHLMVENIFMLLLHTYSIFIYFLLKDT